MKELSLKELKFVAGGSANGDEMPQQVVDGPKTPGKSVYGGVKVNPRGTLAATVVGALVEYGVGKGADWVLENANKPDPAEQARKDAEAAAKIEADKVAAAAREAQERADDALIAKQLKAMEAKQRDAAIRGK